MGGMGAMGGGAAGVGAGADAGPDPGAMAGGCNDVRLGAGSALLALPRVLPYPR
ncbi:MAG TPA: hypothetical protein VHM70_21620 [Polyangiaceae bacterium]|jgi:hypothetical protein|nr:hypothetical protein [Polyangiaceae bacterium]